MGGTKEYVFGGAESVFSTCFYKKNKKEGRGQILIFSVVSKCMFGLFLNITLTNIVYYSTLLVSFGV